MGFSFILILEPVKKCSVLLWSNLFSLKLNVWTWTKPNNIDKTSELHLIFVGLIFDETFSMPWIQKFLSFSTVLVTPSTFFKMFWKMVVEYYQFYDFNIHPLSFSLRLFRYPLKISVACGLLPSASRERYS